MYELATHGSEICHSGRSHCCLRLLHQGYDDLGIHREACGNKTKKWGAFRNKFTQELLAEHRGLLQSGSNDGLKPGLAARAGRWFDSWFKACGGFAPRYEEGKS
jgi:hypothetical protein